VEVDYELCVGCEKCIPPCPYNSRHKDEGAY